MLLTRYMKEKRGMHTNRNWLGYAMATINQVRLNPGRDFLHSLHRALRSRQMTTRVRSMIVRASLPGSSEVRYRPKAVRFGQVLT